MRTLFGLIPYLVAPFCFPGVSASFRLAALLLTSLACCMTFFRKTTEETTSHIPAVSPFHLAILAGIGACYFGGDSLWSRYALWPTLVGGILLTVASSGRSISPIAGFSFTALIVGIIALFKDSFSFLFPFERFGNVITHVYPMESTTLFEQHGLKQAIQTPAFQTSPEFFQAAVTITAAIFFAWCFSRSRQSVSVVKSIALIVGVSLFILLFGRSAYVIIGTNVFLFLLFTHRSETFEWKKRIIVISLLLAGCIAGFLGWWTPFITTTQNQLAAWIDLSPILEITEALEIKAKETPLMEYGFPTGDWIVTFVILVGLTLSILENARARTSDDTFFPAGLSVLGLSVYWVNPSPLAAMLNPIAWLAMASIHNARRDETDAGEKRQPSAAFSRWKYALAGMAAVLVIPALFNLYSEWKAETNIHRFGQTPRSSEQYQIVQTAFRKAPYRGDLASLYASASIQILLERKVIPTGKERQELDYAFQISSKYGYAPLRAIVRLSDLYITQYDPKPSIEVLESAITYFPNHLLLHELLAEKLDLAGRKDQAINEYRICANLDPSEPQIRRNLAIIYQSLGRRAEADVEWNNLMALDPTVEKPRF